MENTVDCANAIDNVKKKEPKAKGHKQMTAHTFMDNSDDHKCGKMMKNLCKQHVLGNNQCPKDLTTAVDVL